MGAYRRRFLPAALCLFFLLGCSDSMTDEAYSHAWRAAVLEYRKINKNPGDPAADLEGDGDGSNESQSRAAASIAAKIRVVADSIKDLKAPSQFRVLHDETYLFYRGQADGYAGIVSSFGSRDENRVVEAVDRVNNFTIEHQATVGKLIDGLGQKARHFHDSCLDVMKDIKSKPH
jgi:hypothetical protein